MKNIYQFQIYSISFYEKRLVFQNCDIPQKTLDVMENPEAAKKLAEELTIKICEMSLDEADFHDRMARNLPKLQQFIDNQEFDKAKAMIAEGRTIVEAKAEEPYKSKYLELLAELNFDRRMKKGFFRTDQSILRAYDSSDRENYPLWQKVEKALEEARAFLEKDGKKSPKYDWYDREIILRKLDASSRTNTYPSFRFSLKKGDYRYAHDDLGRLREQANQQPKPDEYLKAIDSLEKDVYIKNIEEYIQNANESLKEEDTYFYNGAHERYEKAMTLCEEKRTHLGDKYDFYKTKLDLLEITIAEKYFHFQSSEISRFLSEKEPFLNSARSSLARYKKELGDNKWNIKNSSHFEDLQNRIPKFEIVIENKTESIMNEGFKKVEKNISQNNFNEAGKYLKKVDNWCQYHAQGSPKYDFYMRKLAEFRNQIQAEKIK